MRSKRVFDFQMEKKRYFHSKQEKCYNLYYYNKNLIPYNYYLYNEQENIIILHVLISFYNSSSY